MTDATFEQLGLELANERRRRERAEAAASEARARALRAQLNPHFLFNALTGIVATLDARAAAQRDHVLRLSELLRETLRASEQPEHALCEEFALLCAYLRIEESRRPAFIDWSLRLEPGCEAVTIPSLLLLPLVENATTHGSPGPSGRLCIEIAARRRRGRLLVAITNTCAATERDSNGSGLGLRNVRERLATHYGEGATMRVEHTGGNFEAEMELPWR